MAVRLMGSQSRVVAYMPNLGSMVKHFRTFCSYDGHQSRPTNNVESKVLDSMSEENDADAHLGPLLPTNRRFPMPGKVSTTLGFQQQQQRLQKPSQMSELPDVLTSMLPHERQVMALSQYVPSVESTEEIEAQILSKPSPMDRLECQAIPCPELLRKDFQDLFPHRDLSADHFTIITISQHTKNDMLAWNCDVDEEREELLSTFIAGAIETCTALQANGYWADFIDPASGLPYLSDSNETYGTMFETDDRYRLLGFEIDDLGCCKVIRHHLWGTNAYVGCLFTNAPMDHPVMKTIAKQNSSSSQ